MNFWWNLFLKSLAKTSTSIKRQESQQRAMQELGEVHTNDERIDVIKRHLKRIGENVELFERQQIQKQIDNNDYKTYKRSKEIVRDLKDKLYDLNNIVDDDSVLPLPRGTFLKWSDIKNLEQQKRAEILLELKEFNKMNSSNRKRFLYTLTHLSENLIESIQYKKSKEGKRYDIETIKHARWLMSEARRNGVEKETRAYLNSRFKEEFGSTFEEYFNVKI